MAYNLEHSNAQSNRWFALLEGLPSVEYKLVDFTLPMLTIGVTELGGQGDRTLSIPGDHIDIDEVQLNFLVDKRYLNYFHCFKWMRTNLNQPEADLRDVTVVLLDNQGQPQGVTLIYSDCYPIMIAPVMLDGEGLTNDVVVGLTLKVGDFDMQISADATTPSALATDIPLPL